VTVQVERTTDLSDVPAFRSPVVTGVVAAVWAAVVGLAVCVVTVLLVWLLAVHGAAGPGDAVHGGVLAWLAANHGSVLLTGRSIDLVPLGLVAVPVFALFRSGRWAGRVAVEALPAALAAAVSMALAYAVAAAMIASASAQRGSAAEVGTVLVGATGLALVAGGCGVMQGAELWDELWEALPEPVLPMLRGAAAGLTVRLGGGALLLAGSLAAHFGRVSDVARGMNVGAAGGVGLLLLGLLAVPTGVVWATSYAVGPGFAVGVGTMVAPSGVALGPVPALPLLGALPDTGHAPGASLAALAVAPLAGLVVGWLAARRPAPTAGRTAAEALAAGVLTGVGLGLLALLCSGSLGAVRMSDLGPDSLRVALAAAVEVGVVAAAVAYEGCRHRSTLAAARRRLAGLSHRTLAHLPRLPGRSGRATAR